MAYSDFEISIFESRTANWTPSNIPGGTATVHSGLVSPLIGEGTYCRAFSSVTNGNGANSNQAIAIANAALNGAFASIPVTKAISIRSWIRFDGTSPTTGDGFSYGIFAKGTLTGGSNAEGWGGYKLRLGSLSASGTSIATVNLRLSASQSNGADGTATQVICTGTYVAGTWYKIRLDVIPQGSGADLLIAYTGVGTTGSEVWTQVGSLNIPAAANNFIAWGQSTTRVGLYASRFNSSGSSVTQNGYFDRFQATTVNV